jgi:RES domain-containing protein
MRASMISSWRIVKARYAAAAFDGEGAKRSGGRWNSPGRRVIYTSATASLAILEILAHLGSARALTAWVLIECRFEPQLMTSIDPSTLPPQWQRYPAPAGVQTLGDRWIEAGISAVLAVPSVLVPQEKNYMLNPAHPDFARIEILPAVPFALDARLGGK